ncbi:cytosolic endo-beta-N-acetylglucosaminidase [Anoplophora glabripennis]|uniref:cytosolic endo-beta-N-acetylglucosaminidase n=1 Tax=Anoplophora glabripennis TaxID=217634 RepID=UPI000873F9DF|nr:cytosolic endo-beta-N-acetylglucosaminidase [Anoplophora glabripennis]
MEPDKSDTSIQPSPKKRRTKEELEPEQMENNMMPSLFAECHPITNLEDIEGVIEEPPRWVKRVQPLAPRAPTVVQNILSDCHSDCDHYLPRNRFDARMVPKTLVCHDYKGGYQADKYLHYPDENILGNGYPFYNWAQIDIFVYFSHHLITIPPLCWINVGHRNGVKVLGTLITEFDQGAKICDKIFKNVQTMQQFANSLVKLSSIFGFDGWLLNIENSITNVDVLKKFVVYLSDRVQSDNPNNLVIWYDSVTVEGALDWQNKLSPKNSFFFDACDGIFLNYTWSEKHLLETVEAAKHRNLDVFVGIDIFGRNMFGGGKFSTYKAAEVVTRYNLSIAIFAPGWTHETLERNDIFFEQFLNRDSAFWCSLWPYFYTHPINNYFTTNFYIGLDKACYNMFNQQQQLSKFLHPKNLPSIETYQTITTLSNKCNCIQAVTLGSRNTCLLTKKDLRKNVDYVHHLFVCDLKIADNSVVFHLTKNVDKEAKLSVTILTCGLNNKFRKIKLLADYKYEPVNNASLLEVNPSEANDVYDSVRRRYLKMVEEEEWTLRVYIFNTGPCNILEIGATIEGGDSIYFGAFGIQNADGDFLKKK